MDMYRHLTGEDQSKGLFLKLVVERPMMTMVWAEALFAFPFLRLGECLAHPRYLSLAAVEQIAAGEFLLRAGAASHSIPCGAPGNFIAAMVGAGIGWTMTERPPNNADEPGRICSVVTPAANPWLNPGSTERTACSTHVSAASGREAR